MKTTVNNVSSTKKSIMVEVPVEAVEQQLEKTYIQIAKTAKLSGFRPGKAPIELIKQKYEKDAMSSAADEIMQEYTKKAIEENKLDIVSQAIIKDINYEPGKPFYFDIEVDVRPTVKIGKYTELKLTKKRTEVVKKDIDNTIDYLRQQYSTFVVVEEDRVTQDGDFLLCDIESSLDGKQYEQKKEYMLSLEKDKTKEDFYTNLLGVKKGEAKEFEVAITKEDQIEESFVGKNIKYTVTLKEIKNKQLPEVNEEFAKKAFNVDSIDAMNEQIQKVLENSYKRESFEDMKKQIMEKLAELGSFDLPESLVDRQMKYLTEQAKKDLIQKKGAQAAQVEKVEEDLKEKLVPLAERQVKVMFIFDEIAKQEDIKVNEDDFTEEMEKIASYHGKTKEQVFEEYEKNDLTTGLLMDLRDRKIIEFLIDKAKVTEEKEKETAKK